MNLAEVHLISPNHYCNFQKPYTFILSSAIEATKVLKMGLSSYFHGKYTKVTVYVLKILFQVKVLMDSVFIEHIALKNCHPLNAIVIY